MNTEWENLQIILEQCFEDLENAESAAEKLAARLALEDAVSIRNVMIESIMLKSMYEPRKENPNP